VLRLAKRIKRLSQHFEPLDRGVALGTTGKRLIQQPSAAGAGQDCGSVPSQPIQPQLPGIQAAAIGSLNSMQRLQLK